MREVNPFDFFIDCASAIPGQGGDVVPPDPHYCFHTHYIPVEPGPALYRLTLSGARSTTGELTVRVHAIRADGLSDMLLVGGQKFDLGFHEGEDISLTVRFRAVRGVHYAYYGYFTAPSDLIVADLKVTVEELDDEEEVHDPFAEDVATSVLAPRAIGASASQASALIFADAANLDVPVSQDCTIRQLRSRGFQAEGGRRLEGEDALRLWSEIVCRQSLVAYGATVPGTTGLSIGGSSALLQAFCQGHGMTLRDSDWQFEHGPTALAMNGHVDFLVSWLDIGAIDAEFRYTALTAILSRLMIGGLGVVCFRYVPDAALPSSTTMSAAQELARNEIGQWVLRLIGAGLSIAPLAFAPNAELVRDEAGRASVVLVVRRL